MEIELVTYKTDEFICRDVLEAFWLERMENQIAMAFLDVANSKQGKDTLLQLLRGIK
jgi:hypothetical protein